LENEWKDARPTLKLDNRKPFNSFKKCLQTSDLVKICFKKSKPGKLGKAEQD